MTISLNELNAEIAEGKRFYLRDKGQVIYKYDFYDDALQNITVNQDLLMEDNTEPYSLPEYWYYLSNCPDYIVVTDISLFNTKEADIGKRLFMTASSQTSGSDIVITLDIKHNDYKHITQAYDLTSVSDLDGVTHDIANGTELSINDENVPVYINGFDNVTVNFVNGKGSFVLNGNNVTSTQLNGYVTLDNYGTFNFNLYNITLINSVINSKKMAEIREERDNRLKVCDPLVIRHITQQVIENTTLSEEQYEDLCTYMQELRDVPENISDVDNVEWPEIPHSLVNVL